MTEFIVGAIVGLVVGWNILPQPKWAADIVAKLKFW